MNQLDRLYQLERLLVSRPQSRDSLMETLEVSRATLKRYLELLRDRMNVPVEYDRFSNLYTIKNTGSSATSMRRQELPGVWFSQQEIVALLTIYRLIEDLDSSGMLQRHLQPILQRLTTMLSSADMEAKELQRRVRIVGVARRVVSSKFFETIGLALTKRRQITVVYFTRSRNETSTRTLSPQRLVHHRSTWYLDAYCHSSDGLKRFALDAMRKVAILDARAVELQISLVEAELDEGYGIYAGIKLNWATLLFTSKSAVWVGPEQWHPKQKSKMLPDGSLELKVPYTHDAELLMDILRHGNDVRVLSPRPLRDKLVGILSLALNQYSSESSGSTTSQKL